MQNVDDIIRKEFSFLEQEKGLTFSLHEPFMSRAYVYSDENHCIVIQKINVQDKIVKGLWTLDLRKNYSEAVYVKTPKGGYSTTGGTVFFNSEKGKSFYNQLEIVRKSTEDDELVEQKIINFIADYVKSNIEELYIFCEQINNKKFINSMLKEKNNRTE